MNPKIHQFIVNEGKKNKPKGITNKLSSEVLMAINAVLYRENATPLLMEQMRRDLTISKYHLYDCLGMLYSSNLGDENDINAINRLVYLFIQGSCSEEGFAFAIFDSDLRNTWNSEVEDFLKNI